MACRRTQQSRLPIPVAFFHETPCLFGDGSLIILRPHSICIIENNSLLSFSLEPVQRRLHAHEVFRAELRQGVFDFSKRAHG